MQGFECVGGPSQIEWSCCITPEANLALRQISVKALKRRLLMLFHNHHGIMMASRGASPHICAMSAAILPLTTNTASIMCPSTGTVAKAHIVLLGPDHKAAFFLLSQGPFPTSMYISGLCIDERLPAQLLPTDTQLPLASAPVSLVSVVLQVFRFNDGQLQ